jgi:hypothetical protein
MTWPLLLIPLLMATMSCATSAPVARPDDPLSRLIPSAHSIAPTKPSSPIVGHGVIGTAFDAARVTIEEPSFDEVHSLAWTHNVAVYTAATLNALVPQVDGNADTAVRFETTFDRRDGALGNIVHVYLSTRLSDGQLVQSDVVDGRVEATPRLGLGLAVVGLIASTSTLTLFLFEPEGLSDQQTGGLRWAGLGLSYALGGAGIGLEIFDTLQDEQRWSDVYQQALQAHAADLQRAITASPLTPSALEAAPTSSSTPENVRSP